MKKIVTLILSLALALTLVACGGNNTMNSETKNPVTEENNTD